TSVRQSAADLITDLAKAVQRYLLLLLLRRGTVRYAPAGGLHLPAGHGRVAVADRHRRAPVLPLRPARRPAPARPGRSPADPANEVVRELTPLGVTLAGDWVTLRLLMTTQDDSLTALVVCTHTPERAATHSSGKDGTTCGADQWLFVVAGTGEAV